jgi:hypothetical protein
MAIGDSAPAGYQPVSQSPAMSAPNVVDLRNRKLEDVVSSFRKATGNPDVDLRTHGDASNLRIVVPSDAKSHSSIWTRIKAAFSNLPLFSLSSSLRAARLERDSKAKNAALLNEIVSVVEQEEARFKEDLKVDLKGQYAESVRRELGRKRLTKDNVQFVLTDTLDLMSKYGARLRRERASAQLRGTEAPAAAPPPELRGRREQLTHEQTLSLEGVPVFASKADAPVPARPRNAPSRDKHLLDACTSSVRGRLGTADTSKFDAEVRKLYDETRSFLIRRNKWPLTDPSDAAVAVSYLEG